MTLVVVSIVIISVLLLRRKLVILFSKLGEIIKRGYW